MIGQSTCHKVKATLLQDMQIRQDFDCDHFGLCNSPLYLGVQGVRKADQCTSSAVGGWRRAQTIH